MPSYQITDQDKIATTKAPELQKLSNGKWFIHLRLGGESIPVSSYRKGLRQAGAVHQSGVSGGKASKSERAALCSPKTLKNAWSFIHSVVKDETSQYPPEVTWPAITPSNKPFLTPDQIKVFVQSVSKTKYAVPALLALSSLRISEIATLDWQDILPKPEFIRVAGAIVKNENNQMTWAFTGYVTASRH